MSSVRWSHFISAVVGGLVVAGGLVALGLAGPRRTTVVEEPPVASQAGFATPSGSTINDVYQTDAPAVVLVSAKILERSASPFGFRPVTDGTSTGSGFLVDRKGDVLTSYHVIAGADRTGGVFVTFENNVVLSASVIAVDSRNDVAVLRVDQSRLPPVAPLPLGDSTSVRVGDPTLSLGNAYGTDRSLTTGVVSALQHQIVTSRGTKIDNVIQIDQQAIAANDGGPLLNAGTRKVIGITSELDAVVGSGGASQRLAFAIPIDVAETLLNRVAHQTAVRVAYLGIGPSSAKPSKHGAVVRSIDPHGPAAEAGIKAGDTIVRIDRIPVESISDLLANVSTLSPGKIVTLAVSHRGRIRTVPVTLASHTVSLGSK